MLAPRAVLFAVALASVWFCAVTAAPLSWTLVPPAAGSAVPSARAAMAIGLDAPRQRLILFGGKSGPTDDTWQYNLTSNVWTQLFPPGPRPAPRFSMIYASDSVRQRLVISTGEGANRVFYNDAWAYDYRTDVWSQITPTTDPSGLATPNVRYGAAGGIAAESNGTLFVSHGFFDLTRLSDTYGVAPASDAVAGGQYWLDIGPESGSSIPFGRCLVASSVVSSPALTSTVDGNERVVMFGGCGSLGHGPCPSHDTWRYDRANRRWDELSQCPGPRNRPAMSVWPPASGGLRAANQVVLFGGSGGIFGNGLSGEVSILNADSGAWIRVLPQAADAAVGTPAAGIEWPGMVSIPADSGLASAPYVLVWGGDGHNKMWRLSGVPEDTERLNCPYIFPIREFHGAMMFLSWGFLLPIGVMIARYGKGLTPPDLWFRLHRIIQCTGLVLSIGGFISGILMVPIHPFKLPHHFIGLIVFAIGIQQPINAFFRPHPPENKTRARVCWEHTHKWLGRSAVVLGMINCIIGLFLIHASTPPIVLYLIWCFAVLSFVTYKEIQSCRNPPPEAASAVPHEKLPASGVALAAASVPTN